MTVHQPMTDGVAIGTRVIRADGVFSNDTLIIVLYSSILYRTNIREGR
jgi:hypothetical protein